MGPEHFWWGGAFIFPMIMPIIMLVVVLIILYFIFGRGGFRPPWCDVSDRLPHHARDSETPMDILKKRYAKGEITKNEYEQMKRDILS